MPSMDYATARRVTDELEERLVASLTGERSLDRRTVLGGLGVAGASALGLAGSAGANGDHSAASASTHGRFGAVDEYEGSQFDPHEFLTAFETGEVVGTDADGRPIREFELTAVDVPIEIAPGVEFMSWAYNGQVPGPTLRAIEGELIRIRFTNRGRHAHTIHPHLRNLNPRMDGIPQNGPGVIETDQTFTYEWIAQPAGCHFYHCHSLPLKEHIHRGLYGAMIIDPDPDRVRQNPADYVNAHPSQLTPAMVDDLVETAASRNHERDENDDVNEMVILMNSFDTNFDGDNEVYAANTRAFAYGIGSTDGHGNWEPGETKRPITIDRDRLQRIYLINVTEFDLVNSFHSHSQFFDYYDHGTTLTPTYYNIDTVMQCQAQRGIVELDYSNHEPGLYMFHAHQSEFAELGWMSFFEVV